MSNSCYSASTSKPYAHSYFGGLTLGKVVQIYMKPENLELFLGLPIRDENSGITETFANWLKGECANAAVVLFDPHLKAETPSILVEAR